jgi:hypothetical protein
MDGAMTVRTVGPPAHPRAARATHGDDGRVCQNAIDEDFRIEIEWRTTGTDDEHESILPAAQILRRPIRFAQGMLRGSG